MRFAIPGAVEDFNRNLAALFEVNATRAGCDSPCTATDRGCHLLTIDRKPAESRRANAEKKVSRFRRCQKSGPLHAEGLSSGDFLREIVFGELHVRLGATNKRSGWRSLTRLSSARALVVLDPEFRLVVRSR